MNPPAWHRWPSLVVIRRRSPSRVERTHAQSKAIRLKGRGFSGDSMEDTGVSSGYRWAERKGCLQTAVRLWKRAQRLSGWCGEYWQDFPYRIYKFSCFNVCLGASLLNLFFCVWLVSCRGSVISRGKGSIVLHLNWTRKTECHCHIILCTFFIYTQGQSQSVQLNWVCNAVKSVHASISLLLPPSPKSIASKALAFATVSE